MNGRVFSVAEGMEKIKSVLDIDDPEEFKNAMPWGNFDPQSGNDALMSQGRAIPPFHGRCRCVVVAADVERYTDGYSQVEAIKEIPFDDVTVRTAEIERFCADFADAKEEHALVFAKNGRAYQIVGIVGAVNPAIIGEDLLESSIGIHNHPIIEDGQGDSFSKEDLIFSARCKTGMEYLISGNRRNAFVLTRAFTEEEIRRAWKKAKDTMLAMSHAGVIDIDWEQEIIMQILAEQNGGIEFYEYF